MKGWSAMNDPEQLLELLAEATPQRAKVEAYVGDTYVLESVEHLERLGTDPGAFAARHSLLLLKPDAIVARGAEKALEWLHNNGFRVVDAAAVPVDRHVTRALWYYAWNIASPERRRLADLLVDICDALVLVVTGPETTPPVSVRLATAKGATDPRRRRPGELRYLLGQHNYLLNLVHSPDDPADVLRELSIYFGEHRRAQVIARADGGVDRSAMARGIADDLYARTPARSFDRNDAFERLCRDLERAGVALGSEVEPHSDDDCAQLLGRAWNAGRDIDPWSLIVLGSYVLPMRVGTQQQTLRPVSESDWRESRI